MTTLDERLPAPESDDPAQPIGRVNLRPPGTDDFGGGWSLRAILFGVLALAVTLLMLVVVLNGVYSPMTA